MPLEEALPADAVRRSDDRAGASLQVVHHPRADIFEISRQLELGDGALGLVGPEHLVRTAQGNSHHHAVTGRRTAAPAWFWWRGGREVYGVGGRRPIGFDFFRRLVLT